MFFRRRKKEKRDLPRLCMYCTQAVTLHDPTTVLCSRKGVVGREYSCKKFAYDPLKHIPSQSPKIEQLSAEDIALLEELLGTHSGMEAVEAESDLQSEMAQAAEAAAEKIEALPKESADAKDEAPVSNEPHGDLSEDKSDEDGKNDNLSDDDNFGGNGDGDSAEKTRDEVNGEDKSDKDKSDKEDKVEDSDHGKDKPEASDSDGIPLGVISDMIRESFIALDEEDAPAK